MTRIKYAITGMLGLSCTAVGIWLRLAARDLAWPTEWEYTGPQADTIWAFREHAYQDVSLAILAFGLLLLAIVLFRWLEAPHADNEQGTQS